MKYEEALTAPVLFSATAWQMIGWGNGYFRLKGGRTLYEAIAYNASRNGKHVALYRLKDEGAIRRYVHPDTVLEFVDSVDEKQTQYFLNGIPK